MVQTQTSYKVGISDSTREVKSELYEIFRVLNRFELKSNSTRLIFEERSRLVNWFQATSNLLRAVLFEISREFN